MFSFQGVISPRYLTTCIVSLFFLSAIFSLSACDLAANYTKADRSANAEIQDYRDALAERLPEVDPEEGGKGSHASIPELQPYISASSDAMKSVPLVSVSVNQTVPIKDILFELAKQAEYNIELDPNIRGSIIFTAHNKPFDVVIERISEIAGLRYKFEDSFLRIEVDTPYIKSYKVDYINFIRSNTGGVTSNISVVSGEGADTGSNYAAKTEATSDFWAELELNLQQILGGATTGALKTNRDPRITAAEQNPDVEPLAPQQEGNNVQVQPPEVVLNVESLPLDEGEAPASSGGATGGGSTFSINKQAGIVNVYGTQRVHKDIESYLSDLKKSVTSQVLVEAKVFEVSLSDEYINGIEWQTFTNSLEGGIRFVDSTPGAIIGAISQPSGSIATAADFGLGWLGSDGDIFIKALSGFGTVRALASPRMTVLNNQSAALNVATNRVYFEIDLNRETDDDTGDTTLEVETDIRSVPEGVLINVQPSIDIDSRTISMFVRPTVTRIVNRVADPGVQFVAGSSGIVSEIPEVNVQEIDTVIRVHSGQPVVMGGLLQDRMSNTNEGVPVLSDVPLMGNLFKTQRDFIQKTELVIFLKATILDNPAESVHDVDRDLYRAFSGDRRPLKL